MEDLQISKIIKNFSNGIPKLQKTQLEKIINSLKNPKPLICLLTPILKISTILLYLFKKKIFSTIIPQVLSILILSSFDFWLTKNFFAKKLIGFFFAKIYLKSENKVKFCYKDFGAKIEKNKLNLIFFWFSQFLFLFFWSLLLIMNFLRVFFFEVVLCFFPFFLILNLVWHFSRCVYSEEKIVGKFFGKITKNFLDKKKKFFE